MMGTDRVLREHGTAAFVLPAGALASAAAEDMRRKVFNASRKELKGGGFKAYAFEAEHVKDATGPAHLLKLALAGRSLGACSRKHETRLLYSNYDRMAEALAIAEERYGTAPASEATAA